MDKVFQHTIRELLKMNEIIKRYTMDWKDILYIVIGSFLLSFTFQVFLLPNEIISGGVSSLSIIFYEVFGWEPALVQYAFNIPLLILSYFLLGKAVLFKSILGSLLFPFFTSLISHWQPWTDNQFLAAIYGGVLTGIAVGLVYKAKGSTGGTSIVAQLIAKFTSMSLGTANLIADGVIIIGGFFVFEIESILYGIITLVLLSYFIDFVLIGSKSQKTVLIISEQAHRIQQDIFKYLDRGVTQIDVRGGYKNDAKDMLMVVIQDREITSLQEIILQNDEDAFVVVMSASEVMGRGFSLEKYLPTNQQ